MNKKFFTYIDFYKDYPHKKVDFVEYAEKRRPAFYVKKKEHSEHVHALTYSEYKKILFTFLDELLDYLLEGNTYHTPYGFGDMYFKKIHKSNAKIIDFYNTNKKYGEHNSKVTKELRKYVYFRNDHSGKYFAKFIWTVLSQSQHKPSRKLWTYRLNRTARLIVAEKLMNDLNIIHKINE